MLKIGAILADNLIYSIEDPFKENLCKDAWFFRFEKRMISSKPNLISLKAWTDEPVIL